MFLAFCLVDAKEINYSKFIQYLVGFGFGFDELMALFGAVTVLLGVLVADSLWLCSRDQVGAGFVQDAQVTQEVGDLRSILHYIDNTHLTTTANPAERNSMKMLTNVKFR